MDFSREDQNPYNILVVFHASGSRPKITLTRIISIKTDVCISLYDVNSRAFPKGICGVRPIGRLNTDSA